VLHGSSNADPVIWQDSLKVIVRPSPTESQCLRSGSEDPVDPQQRTGFIGRWIAVFHRE